MNIDKMREEFEAWWLSGTYPFRVMDRLEDAGVSEESAQEIWQASRETMVIDLPQQSGVNLDWNQAIRYCHQTIEAAGVKVKS